jgi:hypothetical protein
MTTEQQEAAENLRRVVGEYLEVHSLGRGVLTDIGVVCAQQYFDKGTPHTTVVSLYPDAPPHYRRLGLLEYECTRLRAVIRGADELTEDEE